MKAHIVSFVKAPVGYLCNFLAHFPILPAGFISRACETFCLRDGVQDECWF